MPGPKPQWRTLRPLPRPLQASFCSLLKLKPFRNSQPFDPEGFALDSGCHDQLMPPFARDLFVGKKVLQFDRPGQPNGLETVAGLPMPEHDGRADPVGVEKLRGLPGRALVRSPLE